MTRWLVPTDFSDVECSGLYAEMTSLPEKKKPVDRLTLAWRATRTGLSGSVCDSPLAAQDLATYPHDPFRSAREVLQQSVRASLLATADLLEGMTRAGETNVTAEAYARLNDLWPRQSRLVQAGMSRG